MVVSEETALKTAELLLQIKAIKLDPVNPFQWASGWKSPIYCDNRVILSYPKIRTFIRQQLADAIEEKFSKPDVVAGVATGAIAHGILAAQALDLPFIYVRPQPKGHGLGNRIEGYYEKEQSVVVVEDLISTGKSSLSAVEALREAGCNVKGMIAIFNYGFPEAIDAMQKADCPFYSLCDYETLLRQAVSVNYINENQLLSLREWRNAPQEWQQANV